MESPVEVRWTHAQGSDAAADERKDGAEHRWRHLQRFRTQLDHYFAGDLTGLDALPVSIGGTPFQQRVWLALREIPAGQTVSYGELAKKVGVPTGARAIGRTNGLNPIGIVLPCHRVLGGNQTLTGYAGGIERKRWLLCHEGASLKDNRDRH